MYLNAIMKQAALAAAALRCRELRSLPLPVLWRMNRLLQDEKLVRLGETVVVNSFLPPLGTRAFSSMAAGLAAVRRGRAVPVSGYIAVTDRCPCRCWHCSSAGRAPGEMPAEVLERLIRELQALGAAIVGFTGGEPLERPDLERLIAAVDERSTSILFTSGAGMNAARAESLKRSGLFGAAVSLDSADGAEHDAMRGRPGAFDAAVAAARAARRAGLYTMLQAVATPALCEPAALAAYLELARDLDAHEIRLLEPAPAGRLLGRCDACVSAGARRAALCRLHVESNRSRSMPKVTAFAHIESAGLYGCGAGFQHLYVDSAGNVCPCDFAPLSFGNVRAESLAAIWDRMSVVFSKPGCRCFALRNSAALARESGGRLPVPFEDVADRLRFPAASELPGFYRAIGWKPKEVRTGRRAWTGLRTAVRSLARAACCLGVLIAAAAFMRWPDRLAALDMRLPAGMATVVGRAADMESWLGFLRVEQAGRPQVMP